MANSFKMVSYDVTTSAAAALTAAAGETIVIIGCSIGNVHASTASHATAKVVQSGGSVESIIANQVSVPVNDALNPIQGKLVLETGDSFQLQSENAASLEATISYMVIT